jgi:hypothetical protein
MVRQGIKMDLVMPCTSHHLHMERGATYKQLTHTCRPCVVNLTTKAQVHKGKAATNQPHHSLPTPAPQLEAKNHQEHHLFFMYTTRSSSDNKTGKYYQDPKGITDARRNRLKSRR